MYDVNLGCSMGVDQRAVVDLGVYELSECQAVVPLGLHGQSD